MKALNALSVIAAALIGIILAFEFGPLSSFQSFHPVDDEYFSALSKQYYLGGIVSSFLACLIGFLLRVNFRTTFISLFTAGVLFVFVTQIGEQLSIGLIVGATIEFMIPFLSVCSFMILLFYGINKLCPRII